jgi:hypothetical protein
MTKSEALKALKAEVKALKKDRVQLAKLGMDIVSLLEDMTETLGCQDNGDLSEVYMDFHCSIPDNEDEDEEDEEDNVEDEDEDEVEDEVEEARIKMIKHKFGW